MKVLFVGDSPTVSTGFARCTRVACEALISHGHEVTVLGMAYYGDPHSYPFEIWPCYAPFDNAQSYGGEARLPSMIARVKPDVIVILQDPWNLPPYFQCLDAVAEKCKENNIEFDIPPVVGWLAVDSKNQKGEQLERLSHIMVWTGYAQEEFKLAGYQGSCDIVPLGVDAELFYPRDKKESRIELGFNQLGIPLDSFIVGVVGRNQPRKRLDLTLDYFSAWMHRYCVEDAYLYLHVAPTGDASCDLKSLVKYFDLRGKVIVHIPDVGIGDEDSRMPFVYSAMDVYMTQAQGEGFCLPALEAMACGVECVLPDHSAFNTKNGWVKENCAYRVSCSGAALTAPQGRNPYTVGAIADKEETIIALSWIYQHRNYFNFEARKLVSELTWENTGNSFVESLERFMITREEEIKAQEAQQVIDLSEAKKVDVCITVLNRYDLLRKCLESLQTVKNRGSVYIIDNGLNHDAMNECIADLTFDPTVINTQRLGLAESWNLFISCTQDCRVIANDDIEFSVNSLKALTGCPADLVFPQGIGFSCFLLRDSCVEKIGKFDENLSPGFAYFEDCDYINRVERYCKENPSDLIAMQDVVDHGILHLKNGTQKAIYSADEQLKYKQRYYIAQENFISKWQSLPVGLRRMEKSEVEAIEETVGAVNG